MAEIVVTDEAVWVAARRYNEHVKTQPSHPDAMHAALEAALPYLTGDKKPSDEAVEAARTAYLTMGRVQHDSTPQERFRAALEAAAPLMGATPVASRERIAEVLHREKHSETCIFTNQTNCGEWHAALREAAALLAAGVFREPVQVDREALERVLATHRIECTGPGEVTCRDCRDKGWMSWSAFHGHIADRLLALLSPEETK